MSKESAAKIQRWRKYIDEFREEVRFLSEEGQRETEAIIAHYETLIALARNEARSPTS
jgi:hypothetical protein